MRRIPNLERVGGPHIHRRTDAFETIQNQIHSEIFALNSICLQLRKKFRNRKNWKIPIPEKNVWMWARALESHTVEGAVGLRKGEGGGRSPLRHAWPTAGGPSGTPGGPATLAAALASRSAAGLPGGGATGPIPRPELGTMGGGSAHPWTAPRRPRGGRGESEALSCSAQPRGGRILNLLAIPRLPMSSIHPGGGTEPPHACPSACTAAVCLPSVRGTEGVRSVSMVTPPLQFAVPKWRVVFE